MFNIKLTFLVTIKFSFTQVSLMGERTTCIRRLQSFSTSNTRKQNRTNRDKSLSKKRNYFAIVKQEFKSRRRNMTQR